jgi:AraC-like DNA-binding protein
MVRYALVEIAARPASRGLFKGRIEHFAVDELEFSVISSEAQHISRTGRLIARGREECAMLNIQLSGHGVVAQDGRATLLRPGAMTFLDSTRPYTLDFDGTFTQLVVQAPQSVVSRRALASATAVELSPSGPGRLISDFLVGMERQHRLDPVAANMLIPHAVGLVNSALGIASRTQPAPRSSAALTRERVHQFIRRHAHDPSLDADAVAVGCGISRRTLFRALSEAEETFTSVLRQVRVERARSALRNMPRQPLAFIAQHCGFAGEVQMHRAFREIVGTTPAAYRDAAHKQEPRMLRACPAQG